MSKYLVIGAGSMGRRRLRDLICLRSQAEVICYEPGAERCREVEQQFGIKGYTNLDDALDCEPKIMVISVPPLLHGEYVKLAMQRHMHLFVEVPFVWDCDQMENIALESEDYPGVLGVSASLRYYPPMTLIKKLLQDNAIGRPLYMSHSLGNYLPEWHPNEDYRKFYAGDGSMGGAGLDMIPHELSAIQWWLGPICSVISRTSKISDLEISGSDCQDVMLTFDSGCRGYFHNDVLEMHTRGRRVHIVGSGGVIEWLQDEPFIRLTRESKTTIHVPLSEAPDWNEAIGASHQYRTHAKNEPSDEFTYESCYLREMKHFLGAVDGQHAYTAATIEEELHTVRVLHTILKTSVDQIENRVKETHVVQA